MILQAVVADLAGVYFFEENIMTDITLKLNADPYILSALREDVTSEDVTTNAIMPKSQPGQVAWST